MAEPEIISKFVRKTFPTEIKLLENFKFDQKFFTLV